MSNFRSIFWAKNEYSYNLINNCVNCIKLFDFQILSTLQTKNARMAQHLEKSFPDCLYFHFPDFQRPEKQNPEQHTLEMNYSIL